MKRFRGDLYLPLLIFSVVLSACGSPTGDATFTNIQKNIFTPNCAKSGCHDATTTNESDLNLTTSASYGMLVGVDGSGVASTEQPSIKRVEPGDPVNSYLVQKLEGTAASGARMPKPPALPLSDAEIELIRNWISDGAPQY